jgi:choline dehydrogenase-like flavoprotein
MLFDFNEAWPRVAQSQYDVCICGAGPAGITIARKLAQYKKKVLLLEAGGLTYNDASQDHYRGENVGRTYWVKELRLRYLGGSSNHWGGLCALQDPITFEPREVNGLPGWPITREQYLSGGLDEAKNILDIAATKEILNIAGNDPALLKQPGFDSPWFNQYCFALSLPTRFFEKYGTEIRQSQQIDAYYNANLTDITLDNELSRVKTILVQNYNGQNSDVSASQYVLALGGIENVRLLLNANRQVPKGIGNHSGMVGRCFMESLNVPIGRFLVTDPKFWRGASIALVPSEALMRQKDIGNGSIGYDSNLSAEAALKGYGRLRVLKEFIHETGCFSPTLMKLARQLIDFNCPGDGVIGSIIEQEPNPNSRVSLVNNVDSLGLRRIQLNWQLCDADLKTIRVLSVESAKEMARLNLARVQLAPFILENHLEIPVSGFGHHMGTTRMAADPRYGVVDENCRVHGIENLYLAGSSVFPRCGGHNPTLSIVLLSLRLGEFLSKNS